MKINITVAASVREVFFSSIVRGAAVVIGDAVDILSYKIFRFVSVVQAFTDHALGGVNLWWVAITPCWTGLHLAHPSHLILISVNLLTYNATSIAIQYNYKNYLSSSGKT